MPQDFLQWIILLLIGLLFGRDYILKPILKKWGFGEEKEERDERVDKQDAEFIGYVKAKLENIEKSIEEIKSDGKATRERLTQHLDDEERNRREDMGDIHGELEKIHTRIDELKA